MRSIVSRPAATPAAVDDGQQRLDPGRAVADAVEGDPRHGAGFLDGTPVRDVVGRHQVEVAVREAVPQDVAIGPLAEGRRDDRARRRRAGPAGRSASRRAPGSAGTSRRTRARRQPSPRRTWRSAAAGREMHDVDRRAVGPGEGHRSVGGDRLGLGRTRGSVVARCRITTLKRRADRGVDAGPGPRSGPGACRPARPAPASPRRCAPGRAGSRTP